VVGERPFDESCEIVVITIPVCHYSSGAAPTTKTIQVSDAIGATDEISRLHTALRQPIESLGVDDEVARIHFAERLLTDSLGVDDEAARAHFAERGLTDSLGVDDEVGRIVHALRSLTDSLGLLNEFTIEHTAGGGDPTITVNPTSLDVSSGQQTYALTGSNLTADISITMSGPDVGNFQISLTGVGLDWGSSRTATQSGGSVNTTVYVRKNPNINLFPGTYTCTVHNDSTGATQKNVSISYTEPET
jgi:hypothetical protein